MINGSNTTYIKGAREIILQSRSGRNFVNVAGAGGFNVMTAESYSVVPAGVVTRALKPRHPTGWASALICWGMTTVNDLPSAATVQMTSNHENVSPGANGITWMNESVIPPLKSDPVNVTVLFGRVTFGEDHVTVGFTVGAVAGPPLHMIAPGGGGLTDLLGASGLGSVLLNCAPASETTPVSAALVARAAIVRTGSFIRRIIAMPTCTS